MTLQIPMDIGNDVFPPLTAKEGLCFSCPLPDCDDTHVGCLQRARFGRQYKDSYYAQHRVRIIARILERRNAKEV